MPTELSRVTARNLYEHFGLQRRQMLDLARLLVEAESPSGDGEGSRAVVSLLADAARSIECVTKVERVAANVNYGEHLRVTASGDAASDERSVLLLGHTDTVHPRGSWRESLWREDDGRIYGPGVFDMKANCALAVEVLRACCSLGITPARPVVMLLTCDEEAGSFSGRALVEEEARRAAAVLVLEPPAPGGHAKTERKGTAGYTVTAHGRAAHAGLEPEKGASAILEMSRQIERLHGLNDLARGTTINVGVVSGGTRSNVVAAEARAEVDVRFTTMSEAQRIGKVVGELQPFDERVRLTIEGEINRPPLERTEAVMSLYSHARRVAAALDFELRETSVGGASDGNFAAAIGAAVLDGLGIDGGGAHADHEHIIVDDVARRGALLAGLIATL
ncbi:MAG TPA: M20 family metallopeptidase [Pyrinomonadaceae bacterium]|nr:M20 family metallopeptidase [Pyrinomonadaceae bacterium]